jgi:hypothetical protein
MQMRRIPPAAFVLAACLMILPVRIAPAYATGRVDADEVRDF